MLTKTIEEIFNIEKTHVLLVHIEEGEQVWSQLQGLLLHQALSERFKFSDSYKKYFEDAINEHYDEGGACFHFFTHDTMKTSHFYKELDFFSNNRSGMEHEHPGMEIIDHKEFIEKLNNYAEYSVKELIEQLDKIEEKWH